MASIKTFIKEGEHEQQDFKMRIDDQKKIARTLAAFANTTGGRLLIGVKDNGKIVGINPEEEFHMIQGAAELFCQPPVSFSTNIWQEDLRLVLEVIVPPSSEKFVKAIDEDGKWKFFLRVQDETIKANKIIIQLWKLKRNSVEKPLTFRNEELECLQVIASEENGVTLSQLYKRLPSEKKNIERSLALLIHWQIVSWKFTENSFKYFVIER